MTTAHTFKTFTVIIPDKTEVKGAVVFLFPLAGLFFFLSGSSAGGAVLNTVIKTQNL